MRRRRSRGGKGPHFLLPTHSLALCLPQASHCPAQPRPQQASCLGPLAPFCWENGSSANSRPRSLPATTPIFASPQGPLLSLPYRGPPALPRPRGTGVIQPGGHPPESSTSQLPSLPWEPCVHLLFELGPCSHSLSHRRPSITTGVIHVSGFSLLLFSILRNTLQNFHHHKNRTSVVGGGGGGC